MSRSAMLLCATAAAILVVVLSTVIVVQRWSPYPQNRFGGDFAMVDTSGHPVTQTDLVGRPTVLYFGYTYCPDVCPTTLLQLTNAMAKMGRLADRLNVVFVTVDPKRDTPEQMRLYLSSFDPRIRGFTGTEAQAAAMAKAYHVYYRRVPDENGDYVMDHFAGIMLFDAAGALQGIVTYDGGEKDLLAKLTALAEPGTCHRGLPTPSSLWDRPGSASLCDAS